MVDEKLGMSVEKVCGIKLTGSKEEECSVAVLGEELKTLSTKDDSEIIELVVEEMPSVVAFTNPFTKRNDKGFREKEKKLVDDGHSFLPPSMFDGNLIERTFYIKKVLENRYGPQFIETRPKITSEVLGIEEDRDLDLLGIESSGIKNMKEFEAVLAAYTARKFLENDYVDRGFIFPKED